MKAIIKKRPNYFLLLTLLILTTSCSSRNLYRNVRLEQPPIERSFVYLTTDSYPDAGVEPVDMGSVLPIKNTVYIAHSTESPTMGASSVGLKAMYRNGFQQKWFFKVKNGLSSEILFVDQSEMGSSATLFFGANDGNFYALDAESGRVLWRYETKAPVFAKPTLSNHKIYFLSSDDVLYCLDASTGKWLWHYKRSISFVTTVRGNSTPVIEDNKVYIGFSDGFAAALNASDGNLKWETKIHSGSKFTDVDAMAVIDGNTLYIPSYDGGLYSLDKSNGKILWKVDVGSSKKVLLDDRFLYVGSTDGYIYSLNKENGRILWKFQLDDGTPTNLTLFQNYLAFGSSTQYFYVIHKGDGSLAYRYSAGLRSGFASTPALIDRELYVLSKFGNVYVFKWLN